MHNLGALADPVEPKYFHWLAGTIPGELYEHMQMLIASYIMRKKVLVQQRLICLEAGLKISGLARGSGLAGAYMRPL